MTSDGPRCGVCGTACSAAEHLTCLLCEAVYHRTCALYHRRCSVYGCPSRVFVDVAESPLGGDLEKLCRAQNLRDLGFTMAAFLPTAGASALFNLAVIPRTDSLLALVAAVLLALVSLASYFTSGRGRLLSEAGDHVDELWFYLGRRVGRVRVHMVGPHAFFWVHDCGKGVDVVLADVDAADADDFPAAGGARIAVHHLRRMYAFSSSNPGEVMPFIEAAERQDRPVLVAAPREWVVSAIRNGITRRASRTTTTPRPTPAGKEDLAT